MNSGTDSAMTYLVPSTSVMTVSGVHSARSTRSGVRANTAPLMRVTRITYIRPWVVVWSWLVGRPWPVFTCHYGDLTVADEIRPVALRVQLNGYTATAGKGTSVPFPAGRRALVVPCRW